MVKNEYSASLHKIKFSQLLFLLLVSTIDHKSCVYGQQGANGAFSSRAVLLNL